MNCLRSTIFCLSQANPPCGSAASADSTLCQDRLPWILPSSDDQDCLSVKFRRRILDTVAGLSQGRHKSNHHVNKKDIGRRLLALKISHEYTYGSYILR